MTQPTYPKIALGTWSWGVGTYGGDAVFGQTLSEAQMQEVFDTAMQAGLNLWDTAYAYGLGDSEKELGKIIRRWPKGSVVTLHAATDPHQTGGA